MLANISGFLVNALMLYLFFKFLWPFISNYISLVDSAIIALITTFLIRKYIFSNDIHLVFIILIFIGIFVLCMWIMHTKFGFIISSLFLSYIWTDLIIREISGTWASYDLIWGIFIGICSFSLIFYFHWKDYKSFKI